jgi:hypothetical protein
MRRIVRVSTLVSTLLLAVLHANAAAPVEAASGTIAGGLSIKIDENRVPLVAGASFSVSATLTNNSNSIVYLSEQYLRLKVAPEVEGPNAQPSSFWYGFLTAANHGEAQGQNTQATLALKPHEQTSAWWSWSLGSLTGTPACKTTLCYLKRQLSDGLAYLFFEPGLYRLAITANYWDNDKLQGNPYLAVETKTLDVAVPQSVILIGAAIGGLIAYLILPQARRRLMATARSNPNVVAVVGACGAMLFSAIITILMARISESQFLIRVTVNDVWGAIAIGFIANYVGVEALNKITSRRKQVAAAAADHKHGR